MKFNLASLNQETKTIKNTDAVFEGTPLASQEFAVEVSRLSRANKIDTMTKAVLDDGTISNGEYSKALFVASISDAEGFTNENDEAITVADGVASVIWELAPDALVEAIKSAITGFNAIEEKKSEVLEVDSTNSLLGQ